jgi:MraZ protein
MTAADDNDPIYTSRFRHGVDEKRRIQIPARWRPSRPDVEFVLIQWPTGCLVALPPHEWRKLVNQIKSMDFTDDNAEVLRRLIGGNAAQVTLDRSGRICLPEDMAREVGIEKEALFVGLIDRFEIWSVERGTALSAEDKSKAPEALKALSNAIKQASQKVTGPSKPADC